MKSIYLRNFMAVALMVLVCFLILISSFFSICRNYIVSEYRVDMENSARELARVANAMGQTESLSGWSLRMSLSSISNATGNHVFVTDKNGVVVNCSDRAPVCEHMGMVIDPEIIKVIDAKGEFDQMSTAAGFYKHNRYVVALPIAGNSAHNPGYVFVSNVIDNILGAWSTFMALAMFISGGVFVSALLVTLIYSKRMARPLDEIAAASGKFARGDFSARVRQVEDSSDEMGALIESFNRMADSLETAETHRSEFIANVSHELRTPMTTIAGFADGILDGTIPEDKQDEYLRAIRDETRRLSRLVREMLDSSQAASRSADKSRHTVFDLTELMLQTLFSFESRAVQKGLDVDPQLPENNIMVKADKDAITRVIYNLLDNAVKFADPDSCITLRVYKDREKAYVSVKDYGQTIPADDLPYIFDRFHKSDRSRSVDKDGVGLGLHLVKTIINNHNEDIVVKSEDGMTECVFTLPLAE